MTFKLLTNLLPFWKIMFYTNKINMYLKCLNWLKYRLNSLTIERKWTRPH